MPTNESPMERLESARRSDKVPATGQNGFLKDTLSDLLRGPKAMSQLKKESGQKSDQTTISRRDLREELKKAYDPYAYLDQKQRVEFEKEITSKRAQQIDDKDVTKFLKDLKKEPSDKKFRFFDKFWRNFKK